MKLSVVIVNYNVKYFLEQCLISVQRACRELEAEVFVVDNDSMDGSVEMVQQRFPWVRLIANRENVGFSRANNQAMREAQGEYVLLLNPDTVVEEDTFSKCIDFMDANPGAGGLGVLMVDGKGNFLPESKRGLPTPIVAFYKIFGLSALFPKSRTFGRYHLGFLDKDQTHSVDVLAGAYMWMRKSVLDNIGLLDETFFMYGEDIDLSWRIKQGGFENYYFPETRIIHYKGESTKKGSLNYVFVFYQAMIIFARKHFSKSYAGLFAFFIYIAIYFRAALSIARRFIQRAFIPFLDWAMITGGLHLIRLAYEQATGMHYPSVLVNWAFALYAVILIFFMYLYGGYDKPVKPQKIAKGIGVGAIAVLLTYSLLSEQYRFSRAIVVAGAFSSILLVIGLRGILHLLNIKGYNLRMSLKKRFAFVGEHEECQRVQHLLQQIGIVPDFSIEVQPDDRFQNDTDEYVGKVSVLPEIVESFRINELVFCLQDFTSQTIISQMSRLQRYNLEYKIAPPDSSFIIGSSSVNAPGEFYTLLDVSNINTPGNQRSKRLLDLATCSVLIITLPIWLLLSPSRGAFVRGLPRVLIGQRTWVGYIASTPAQHLLPVIKIGIFDLQNSQPEPNINEDQAQKMNFNYASNYSFWKDLRIIWKRLVNQA